MRYRLLFLTCLITFAVFGQPPRTTRARRVATSPPPAEQAALPAADSSHTFNLIVKAGEESEASCLPDTTSRVPLSPYRMVPWKTAPETGELLIILGFEHTNALQSKWSLINVKNGNKKNGQFQDGKFVFPIGAFPESADFALYQLKNETNNTCAKIVIRISSQEATPPLIKANIPDLVITATPLLPSDNCNSCAPEGNIVTYDFSKNSLKNKRVAHGKAINEDYLSGRWWRRLPRVGQELTFSVANVNPFKYDITLTDEPRMHNVDAPSTLLDAFSFPKGAFATADDEEGEASQDKANLKQALEQLEKEVQKKMMDFQNAGDCFNPCSYATLFITEVCSYFTQQFGYQPTVLLEEFLRTKVNALFSGDDDKKTKEDLLKIIDRFHDFRNMAVGTYSYRVLQIKNVDQYIFKLNITPKPNSNAGARVLNQEVAVNILGSFKVDVTSGLFGTNLVDRNYVLRSDSSVVRTTNGFSDSIVYNRRKRVLEEGTGKRDFGFASFFHFYPKLTTGLNFSFSLGAGVTFSDRPKLRYLAGFSLLGGNTNRLALTYGWALGYVDRLSSRYDDQRDPATGFIFTTNSDSKVETRKVFKSRSFIALTYSIPFIRKKEEVKATPEAATPPAEATAKKDKGKDEGDDGKEKDKTKKD